MQLESKMATTSTRKSTNPFDDVDEPENPFWDEHAPGNPEIEEAVAELNLGVLDLTSDEFILDEVDIHIQQNLEDEVVKAALESGVDLRQYSKQIEAELQEVENASIDDYIKESQNIASLHNQITACDTILERMEQMLNGFQSDLGSLSAEIQTLQEQSIAMNVKLKNRQAVRGELSQFVDEMAVNERMINIVLEAPVTDRQFLEQLHELNHKIRFVKEQAFKDALSCRDVEDILEKLKLKAIFKIREFILQKVNQMKKPMTNYQLQQNAMLKARFFYEFLLANERHVAKEVRDEYVDTMSKVYFSYFKGYINRLMKLQVRYIKESQNIASLHNQITACDTILERMEQMLNGFQSDLGSLSAEIQTLQEQSIAMNVKLKNRQAVRGELSQFVDEMAVNERMINIVLEAPVTDRQFLEQLHELNHKIRFVKEQAFKDALSCRDVEDILEKLKLKAIFKIREFILQKVNQMKKPMTNYQLQQNAMLKARFFYEFLLANERHVAKEVRDEYVDTMSKVYFSYFKGYINRLMKLQVLILNVLQKYQDDFVQTCFVKMLQCHTELGHAPGITYRLVAYQQDSLEAVIQGVIDGINVEHSKMEHTFESLFRSQHFALLDNCCREYLFVCDFFMVSGSNAQDLFTNLLGKTLSMFLKHMDTYTNECYDSIAVFLCIHIIQRYRVLMHKRSVPALDKYWETLFEMIWPRIKHILEPKSRITRRYAEYSGAIVNLNETFPDERVNRLLLKLQSEVENFILRMAAEFPSRKEQLIFLINNYDMMLNVITECTSEDSREAESFRQLLDARTQEFIEEVLAPHFGGMMSFVKDAENRIERGQADHLKSQERHVEQLVRGFSSGWKQAIELINQEIMRSFTNFKNGTGILQGALTQLIQYYHRFQKVLSQNPLKALSVRGELINIHHLMVEVKKHKPAF
eukprot:XP_011674743.1 PREDICTED: vacuolar protein sorting-associated protein 52 homolog [Strongylocentrotus purpuratus]